jgi:hypothetical protein
MEWKENHGLYTSIKWTNKLSASQFVSVTPVEVFNDARGLWPLADVHT